MAQHKNRNPFGESHHDWDGLVTPKFLGSKPVVIDVRGDIACFTNPAMSSERVSYPIITPTAAVGIATAVYWKPQIRWVVQKVEVMAPLAWTRFMRNEVPKPGPLDVSEGSNRSQRSTLALRDVHYRIHVQPWVHPEADGREGLNIPEKSRDRLRKRLRRGEFFTQPCLGLREFIADVTLVEDDEHLDPPIDWTEDLGLMLHSTRYADRNQKETYDWFDARVENGVMHVPRLGLLAQHNTGAAS